ncbi:MAG: hypothetical protein A2519_21710, partial [Candidatus Raymondbacteria bacterium RIFOXYD12_FULL_49_13]
CAIHQPQYLAYVGYFHKMALCDAFVLLNDAQYHKNEWQNRNRIKTAQGEQFLTVPVNYSFPQLLSEVTVDSRQKWAKKHLAALEMNYSRAPFFKQFFPEIATILSREYHSLSDLNATLIKAIATILGLRCSIVLASDLKIKGHSTQRLIAICKALSADTYLSGPGGKQYLDENAFPTAGISLQYQEFTCPQYPQVAFKEQKTFIPNLSIIDLLFNCGEKSLEILMTGGAI